MRTACEEIAKAEPSAGIIGPVRVRAFRFFYRLAFDKVVIAFQPTL